MPRNGEGPDWPADAHVRALRPERLAVGAVPGSATGDTRLLDRGAAPETRLVGAAVDAELVLHPPFDSVGSSIVAQGRALAGDTEAERAPDAANQRAQLAGAEGLAGAQWMQARPPQCLVCVDVPDAGEQPLVEQERLQRRPPPRQPVRERPRVERAPERLCPDARCQVMLELTRLEQEPCAETTDVAIGDVRAVV